MSYKMTNISGGQIVCNLREGTLRLKNKQSKVIQESQMTKHIDNLGKKGLLLIEQVTLENQTKSAKKDSTTNSSNKQKEVVTNG